MGHLFLKLITSVVFDAENLLIFSNGVLSKTIDSIFLVVFVFNF